MINNNKEYQLQLTSSDFAQLNNAKLNPASLFIDKYFPIPLSGSHAIKIQSDTFRRHFSRKGRFKSNARSICSSLHIAQSVLKYLHRYSERNLSASEIYVAEIHRDSEGTRCRRPKCNKVLNVITFCPKCNKLFRVITLIRPY